MKVRPVLIPTDRSYLYLHTNTLYNNRTTQHIPNGNQQPVELLLINTEADIVDGDLVYENNLNDEQSVYKVYDRNGLVFFRFRNVPIRLNRDQHNCKKVICSINKHHNLPQPSEQSIQLLINYYNEHKCMPESVEVEWFSEIQTKGTSEFDFYEEDVEVIKLKHN